MAKLKQFLEKYDTILFDMDGVITSEQAYWTCAALTVYEMLCSKNYFGTESVNRRGMLDKSADIRRRVFLDDKVISLLKNKGVNSNWDLAYIMLCAAVCEDSFGKACDFLCTLSDNILDEYDNIARRMSEKTRSSFEECVRGGRLWRGVVDMFQKIYNGTDDVAGLIECEEPLFSAEKTRHVLSALYSGGKSLGIGTGRMLREITEPLMRWGVWDFFDNDRIVTYDDVEAGERAVPGAVLTKPHPFMFLMGALGKGADAAEIVSGKYDLKRLERTLVVGDAGADILAAHAGDMDFLAVLTGVSGESARGYFEEQKAEYILGSVCEMVD